MKLTILGTGNATVSECYNTCYAISDEGKHFLVDAGGGNRILKVLKDTGIDMNDIHDIFVTHEQCRPRAWNYLAGAYDRTENEPGKI